MDWHCRNGGCGAIMSGLFRLERGQNLRVLCGSMSTMGPHGNSGGGGGPTWLQKTKTTLLSWLVVAEEQGEEDRSHMVVMVQSKPTSLSRLITTCAFQLQSLPGRAGVRVSWHSFTAFEHIKMRVLR